MTDKIKGLIVTTKERYRDDDVQEIIKAIKMIKGVESVGYSVDNPEDQMNRMIFKDELRKKFYDFMSQHLL